MFFIQMSFWNDTIAPFSKKKNLPPSPSTTTPSYASAATPDFSTREAADTASY